jgi:hypothetical protein
MTRLLRWLSPLLLLGGLWLPFAGAQGPAPAPTADPKVIDAGGGPSPLPYTIAVLYTAVVLVLICMPSRKGA